MKHLREDALYRLRKELELDAVPQAVDARLRQVYAELPGEVPETFAGTAIGRGPLEDYEEVVPVAVRRKPWPVRCALGACGVLAFAGLLLLGLSISRIPVNVGAPPEDASLAPQTSSLAAPEDGSSQPVDSGYSLSVKGAFCDGQYVYFALELLCPDDAPANQNLIPRSGEHDLWKYGMEVKDSQEPRFFVDGTEVFSVKRETIGSIEDGIIGWDYAISLPQMDEGSTEYNPIETENGQELNVTLQVDYLKDTFQGEQTDMQGTIPVNFKTDFPVTVNLDGAVESQPEDLAARESNCVPPDYQGQDNGVSVLGVESTPEYIKLDLQVPVWGYSLEEAVEIATVPKGTYDDCVLYTEDGEEIPANYDLFRDPEAEYEKMEKLKKGDMYPFTMGFDPAPEGCKKVILRVFEYHPDTRLMCRKDMWEEDYKANLFAELTIDLETGEATPSDTYIQEGYTKLDTEEYLNTYHTPGFTGGYYIQNRYSESLDNAANAAWSIHLRLCADVEQPDLEFRFFRNGELYDSIHASADQGTPGVIEIDGEVGYYTSEGENTFFTLDRIANWEKKVMRDMGFQTIPQWRIQVVMSGPEYPIPDKIQLVDGKTGEVLMDDVQEYTAIPVDKE